MKTQNTLGKTIIVLFMTITAFAVTPAQAQNSYKRNYFRGPSNSVVALSGGLSTRSSTITSDIDYLNKMKASLGGWESSLMIGGNYVRVRAGFGSFKTALSDVNSIKQKSINGLVNIYVPGMTKHFRPYAITGIDVNMFTFKGAYVPKSPLILSNPALLCTCQTGQSSTLPGLPSPPNVSSASTLGLPIPPPNPGDEQTTTTEDQSPIAPEVNTARMTSTQLVSGLGAEFNYRLNGRFFNMFGEMRYGLPIGVTTQNASMNETKVKKNVAVAFGVAIGLKGHRKAFKGSVR